MQMFRARSRVAFIDDDLGDFLEPLILSMPGGFAPTFHRHPSTLPPLMAHTAARLRQEQAAFLAIAAAQSTAAESVVRLALDFFASADRFEITSVLVADYSMPAEDGVSICARHDMRGLQRILLTGMADERQAIAAFNARSIEMFIPKQADGLREKLIAAIESQVEESAAVRASSLAQTLSPSLVALLQLPGIEASLHRLLLQHGVVEYIALGAPQGILAVTEAGSVLWIQLEDQQSLDALVEGMETEHHKDDDVDLVRQRQVFVALDFMTQLGRPAASAPARLLSEKPYLGAAVFQIDSLPYALRPAIHSQWIATLPPKTVE